MRQLPDRRIIHTVGLYLHQCERFILMEIVPATLKSILDIKKKELIESLFLNSLSGISLRTQL